MANEPRYHCALCTKLFIPRKGGRTMRFCQPECKKAFDICLNALVKAMIKAGRITPAHITQTFVEGAKSESTRLMASLGRSGISRAKAIEILTSIGSGPRSSQARTRR